MGSGLEIERKYLIRMPDEAFLAAQEGCRIWRIEQIYLADGADGSTRRIRSICENGAYSYMFTNKRRISHISCVETENAISKEEFDRLRAQADKKLNPIFKCRYRIPYAGQLLEIDIYSFWKDRATLEVEIESEHVQPDLPEWVELVREVTADAAYKNRRMAKTPPVEDIF